MKWLELKLDTSPAGLEAATQLLEEQGITGLVIDDEGDFRDFLEHNHQYWDYVDEELMQEKQGLCRITFYLSDDPEGYHRLAQVRMALSQLKAAHPEYAPLLLTMNELEDADWENNWKQFYKPMEIGERLIVVPEWEQANTQGRIPLILNPGLTFGTGSHATTRLCLTALEETIHGGERVLDLGCGSGILGIGALLLGCAHVTGCDIDPKAPEVAAANAALNGFYEDRFTVCAGDILADAGLRRRLGTGYDIVLANIVADVIIPLAALAPAFLAPGGTFVCSGIIDGREDEVAAALTRAGFTVTAHDTLEEWHCFTSVLA
jgi:ribosomal protein L11 methyltransferase